MYVLRVSNVTPPIYISVDDNFIDKTPDVNKALQFNRQQDADKFKTILVDAVDSVQM